MPTNKAVETADKQRYRSDMHDERSSSCSSDKKTCDGDDDDPNNTSYIRTLDDAADERVLCAALGILTPQREPQYEGDRALGDRYSQTHAYAPNPDADEVDLSVLRGTKDDNRDSRLDDKDTTGSELNALAEILPGLIDPNTNQILYSPKSEKETQDRYHREISQLVTEKPSSSSVLHRPPEIQQVQSTLVETGKEYNSPKLNKSMVKSRVKELEALCEIEMKEEKDMSSSSSSDHNTKSAHDDGDIKAIDGFDVPSSANSTPNRQYESTQALPPISMRREPDLSYDDPQPPAPPPRTLSHMHHFSSTTSLDTTTISTHEVRMPMYLPTFKPATGCTNASDFIVRCFVARLRAGITVVKHGRSRWCKSRLRVLHVHSDGRSLSWKPALGEPGSNKRPPKLDLSTCTEVRHAWSPDPLNPMFTGTQILRSKCEAANAHKSFALVFPRRTVDITAVTADQCKVLMEGFSALCFRLQVASLAGKKKAKGETKTNKEGTQGEDDENTTASNTLTNNSIQSPGAVHGIAVKNGPYLWG